MICQVNQYLPPRVGLAYPGVQNLLPAGFLRPSSRYSAHSSYGPARWSIPRRLGINGLLFTGAVRSGCRWGWRTRGSNELSRRHGLLELFRKGYSTRLYWTGACGMELISRFNRAFKVVGFSWGAWLQTLFSQLVALSSVSRAANGTPDLSRKAG